MKLSDIVGQVLKKWPSEIKYITQNQRGEIWGHPDMPSLSARGSWFNEGHFFMLIHETHVLAEDWNIAMVQKRDWALSAHSPTAKEQWAQAIQNAAPTNSVLAMYQAVQEARIKLPSDPE